MVSSRACAAARPPADASPPDASLGAAADVAPAAPDWPAADTGTITYPVDGRFREEDWDQVGRLTMWRPLPPSPTNRFADDPRAAALGRRLSEDPSFSANGCVACTTCHDPARAFADGRPVAEALGRGTPTVRPASNRRGTDGAGVSRPKRALPGSAVRGLAARACARAG